MKKLNLVVLLTLLAVAAQAKPIKILQGTVTSNRNLSADTCYLLRSCFTVAAPATITIPPGTVILGEKSSKGSLIISRGAKINAAGTSTSPIVFTSDQAPNARQRGDWGGIIIAGRATNNQAGSTTTTPPTTKGEFLIEGPCERIIAGGSDDNDNSGVLSFVQIHFAGIAFSANNEINSLTLCSVGAGTTINNIQVTGANDDAIEWFGGTVNAKYLIAFNTRDDDFDTDFGFRGKVQFAVALRKDTTSHDVSGSNGFESDNDAAGSVNTPFTRPVFSNVTLLGPRYCTPGTSFNAEFDHGLHLRRNTRTSVYNSIVSSWSWNNNTTGVITKPLFIDGTTRSSTIANTALASEALNFSFNSLHNNISAPANAPAGDAAWVSNSGCSPSIANWLTPGAPACRENGNQLSVSGIGYTQTSICAAASCDAVFDPLFRLGGSTLSAANFTSSDLAGGFFTPVSYRGAFATAATPGADWTDTWTDWTPNCTEYPCVGSPLSKVAAPSDLVIVPNPTEGNTYVEFETATSGKVSLSLVSNNSGLAVLSQTSKVAAGTAHVEFNTANLKAGIYTVKVETADGLLLTGQLIIK